MHQLTLKQLAVAMAAALVVVSTFSLGAGVAAAQVSDDGGLFDGWFDDSADNETSDDDSGFLILKAKSS